MIAHSSSKCLFSFLILDILDHFSIVIKTIDNLMDEEAFKREHGFTISEYIEKGIIMPNIYAYIKIIYMQNFCRLNFTFQYLLGKASADKMNEITNYNEKRRKGSYILATGFGLNAIGTGLSSAGILLAPLTFGLSLGLTIGGGVAFAAGLGAVGTGAAMGNSQSEEAKLAALKTLMIELERMDKIVKKKISTLEVS